MNYNLKLDLLKLEGAFLAEIKIGGEQQSKRCVCIPTDALGVYEGKKGIYVAAKAVAMREPKYEDTHFIAVSVDKDIYDSMTDDQRKNIPIFGGMKPMIQKSIVAAAAEVAENKEDQDEDMPNYR